MLLQNLAWFGLGVFVGISFLITMCALITGSRADKDFNDEFNK